MTPPRLSGGDALVRALVAHGTELVFGIPGTHNLGIYRHLAEHGVKHVTPRHEQGAGFAADGYARVTGKPGICLTTSGPAVLNAMTAITQSYSDSVPVLLISPGMPLRHPGRGNGTLHEVRHQSAALEAVIGYSNRVHSVAEIPLAVAQAFAHMTAGRPRPAHLEIPLDLIDAVDRASDVPPVLVAHPPADAVTIAAAAGRLNTATRPGLIIGGGARGAAEEITVLAERLGAPVVATANGKGTFSEHHYLSIGAGVHHKAVAEFVAECDVVLAIGTELASTDLWNGPLRFPGDLIRIDVDPAQMITNALPDYCLVGDANATVTALNQRLGNGKAGHEATKRAERWQRLFRKHARTQGAAWLPLVEAMNEALSPGAIIAGDSAMACYYGTLSNLLLEGPASFLYPTGFGTLGYGLPAAIGAKMGAPDRQVVALHGDGGVMFTLPELATAAQERLPLPVIICDNGGYGEIRREMADRSDPVHGVNLPGVDFAMVAKGLNCHGLTVDDEDKFATALRKAFTADRPTVLHVVGDLAGA
ncbi:5-guanidino-2-oxopentanoate decarboxylase [Lentzea nigeriaca]|uniref:5-guanidino-2-oxopentanoate decarboxylase n=1 Tax=Lentzea nigeriaca TaxID=1128665 RepID=UPI00195DC650|nr:5-guanidino-2-oxopentanoate decarboxylase [Lentzea nigeriaca]MBM7857342.1 acetolactate synthase-1/2/3 large subunit [Lentzea nigeriaca]